MIDRLNEQQLHSAGWTLGKRRKWPCLVARLDLVVDIGFCLVKCDLVEEG